MLQLLTFTFLIYIAIMCPDPLIAYGFVVLASIDPTVAAVKYLDNRAARKENA